MDFSNRNSTLSVCISALYLAGSLLTGTYALAHPGHGAHGILEGFLHPLLGLDHLLTALAVGLWAAQNGSTARLVLPLTFVSSMIVGSLLGFFSFSLPFHDSGILLSLGILGGALFTSLRLPLSSSIMLIAFFGIFHGNAHGIEMQPTQSSVLYCGGLILATGGLHLAGVGAVTFLNNTLSHARVKWGLRWIGAAMASYSVLLAVL